MTRERTAPTEMTYCRRCGKETPHRVSGHRCVLCQAADDARRRPSYVRGAPTAADMREAFYAERHLKRASWCRAIDWLSDWHGRHPDQQLWWPRDIPVGERGGAAPTDVHFDRSPPDIERMMSDLADAYLRRGFRDRRITRRPPDMQGLKMRVRELQRQVETAR